MNVLQQDETILSRVQQLIEETTTLVANRLNQKNSNVDLQACKDQVQMKFLRLMSSKVESYVKEISSLKKMLDKQTLEIEELRMKLKMQESEVFNVMQDLKQDEKDDLESLSAFKSKI